MLMKDNLMKSWILALSVVVMVAGLAPLSADAKRLGGGGYSGMQRQLPARSTPAPAPTPTPAQPAQANPTTPPTAAAPAAAAPKRSWMGPIAGLAAGLGIAALMSHLGMGAEFGNLVMMLLLGLVAFMAIRFVMGRMRSTPAPQTSPGFNGLQFAGENAGSASGPGWSAAAAQPTSAAHATSFARPTMLPDGFDQAAFERIAKLTFIRMQAANDTADLNDLRQFTTPEMYAAIKLDLQERVDNKEQRTDVVHVDAEVIDVVDERERQVVSVRYHGKIREEANGPVTAFDEVWHLVQPGVGGQWAIAGIQQTQ